MGKKHKEYCALGISMAVIAIITGIPLLVRGIGGDIWDVTYHLLRIEAVKEALTHGDLFPRVNPIFFNGYGYGSSMFYPDVFLLIPAIMNICGISILMSYKLFVLFITLAGTCTTYFSLKFICGNWKIALAGSYVLMLSTFYLADVNNRAGISEYLACVFVPILVAGIYDYFTGGVERTYLFGVAFLGMALSHTIMTYVGILVTVFVFVTMLFIPGKRELVFGPKGQFKKLLLTAVLTVLAASYYIFPLIEQMVSDQFRFNNPWAKIGDYTQSLSSFFKPVGVFLYTADFGVGIPVLVWIAGRVLLGKIKSRWADYFIVAGVLLLLAMSEILPWKYLENTQLNMIQFTYRIYPYALFFLVCGMSVAYAEKRKENWVNRGFLALIIVLSLACGIWENICCLNFGTRAAVNMDFLRENTFWVGAGEWIPQGVTDDVTNGRGAGTVAAVDAELPWTVKGYNEYLFVVDESGGGTYIAPLIYYKGYQAELILANGERQELQVDKSEEGLVRINAPQELSGIIEVRYSGTVVQTLSNVLSCVVLLGIAAVFLANRFRVKNGQIKCIRG